MMGGFLSCCGLEIIGLVVAALSLPFVPFPEL